MVADLVSWVHDGGYNGGEGEGGGGGGDRCVHVIKFPQSFRGADIGWRHKSKTVWATARGMGLRGTWPLAIGFCVGGARRSDAQIWQFLVDGRRDHG